METATIREMQHNFAAYVRRVEQGEKIAIRRRNQIVARLVSDGVSAPAVRKVDWGEVRERRERLWGKGRPRGKPLSEIVSEARGDR